MLVFGFFFILTLLFTNQAFAVDYRDSSGHTPSWAKGAGYHSVLLKCTEIIGDYTRDGNWCMEWTAYVLDQGVENFPNSVTEDKSSIPNFVLEDGPLYSGDLTQFLPHGSDFGDDWQIGKPFTVNDLDQMKNAGVIDIVNQRLVIPDLWDESNFLKISFMIMEFDDAKTTSEFYTKIQESIRSQNFPTSSEYHELEKQGVYAAKMELEKSSEYFVAD